MGPPVRRPRVEDYKALFPGSTELTAAGRPAIFTFSSLHLELDGSLLGVEPALFFSEAAQGVDAIDYAASIAAVAVPVLIE